MTTLFPPHEYREIYLCSQIDANCSIGTRLSLPLSFYGWITATARARSTNELVWHDCSRIFPDAALTVLYQRVAAKRWPVGGAEQGECDAVAVAPGVTRGPVADAAVAVLPQGTETAREECDSAVRRPGDHASETILSRRQSRHGVGSRQRR